ncbi:hypothetical protein [Aureivirga marina]|uniref:hypothetical protein n=1 Tax=Aureivirga marina TaxID=1182451 RepID=UPI0018CAA060|nr:hypothetical protein [Aureivirga marina]
MKKLLSLIFILFLFSCIDDDDPAFAAVDFCPNYQICLTNTQIQTLEADFEKTKSHFESFSTQELIAYFNESQTQHPHTLLLTPEGKILVDNQTPENVNQNLYDEIDKITGSFYIQDIINSAKNVNEKYWISHFIKNPETNRYQQVYGIVGLIEKDGEFILFGAKDFIKTKQ